MTPLGPLIKGEAAIQGVAQSCGSSSVRNKSCVNDEKQIREHKSTFCWLSGICLKRKKRQCPFNLPTAHSLF